MSNERAERRIIDLSHRVRDGMITYPGLPGPQISDHLSRADSRGRYGPDVEFQIGRISMVANTGTYVDAPYHRFADGPDLAELPLDRLADVPGVVVDHRSTSERGTGERGTGERGTGERGTGERGTGERGTGERAASDRGTGDRRTGERAASDRAVTVEHLAGLEVTGRAVLIDTGWDQHWGTPRYADPAHPFLTAEAATWLAERAAAVVGIDSVNIDDMADQLRPAHTILLGAGIPIVEHLCRLDQLPPAGFRFHAVPVGVVGMGTFPVRAYALDPRSVRQGQLSVP